MPFSFILNENISVVKNTHLKNNVLAKSIDTSHIQDQIRVVRTVHIRFFACQNMIEMILIYIKYTCSQERDVYAGVGRAG